MPVGARLAEMARIRLQYDETRQQVQDIQQVSRLWIKRYHQWILKSVVLDQAFKAVRISNPF